MLIDWFTVGAQVLNFLILVWLLKRFLYHPILDAIDAREQKIASQLADAAAQKAAATEEREAFQRKNADFDKERATLLSQAVAAANTERQQLLNEAREAASALGAKRQANLESEARGLHGLISQRTRHEVFAIARKTLGDLAGMTLEERMVEVFAERLRALGEAQRRELRAVLSTSGQPAIVRTSFELPAAQLAVTDAAVKALLGAAAEIRFEVAPDLVSGIELSTDGHKVAWSIAEYLAEMERGIGELLKIKAPATTSPPAELPAGEAHER